MTGTAAGEGGTAGTGGCGCVVGGGGGSQRGVCEHCGRAAVEYMQSDSIAVCGASLTAAAAAAAQIV
jgi:hypothetical protein